MPDEKRTKLQSVCCPTPSPSRCASVLVVRTRRATGMRLSRCCVRMFSSLPQGSMHLKSVMRRVAKRVHPDLFSDCPAEQAVNQKSLALLNEWLSLAATGSEPHGRSYAYNFEFYVRPEAEEEVGNTEAGRPAPLHHVTLSLPPPGRRLHAHGDRSRCVGVPSGSVQPIAHLCVVTATCPVVNSLSPAAAAALRKLLDALGVQEQLMDVSSDESSYSAGLLDILPDATEALRQAESSARSAEDVIRMARAALRMKRNIMVSFAQGAPAGVPSSSTTATDWMTDPRVARAFQTQPAVRSLRNSWPSRWMQRQTVSCAAAPSCWETSLVRIREAGPFGWTAALMLPSLHGPSVC